MIMTISCALLLYGCGTRERNSISMEYYPGAQSRTEETSEENEEAALAQNESDLYVVMSVDTGQRLISLALPDSARTLQYGYTQATQIMDDYGQYMSTAKLTPGRVVTIGALDDEAKLTSIQLAGSAWYQENITRFSIDPSIGMLVIGETKYRYDDHIRVFSGDQEISLAQVNMDDVLSVQGKDKQILSVQVTKGQGTIALTNTELFEGGWISLGTKIYAKITPDMTLDVPEGSYELSVANDGYGDAKTIEVERSKVTVVDLNEYKGEGPKICKVTFEIYVSGAQLYINGDPVDYEEPVELPYGVHQLTVIANGFETWERQMVIHSQEATIQIGEPELSGEEDVSGNEGDAQETDDDEDARGADDAGDSDDDATDGAQNDGETEGTSPEDVTDSSTGKYSDYLDTITDLIASLVTRTDE